MIHPLKKAVRKHCGNCIPKGELWLGSGLFTGEGLPDTLENHIRLADRLGHDILCLPVSDADDLKPEMGYRYFDIRDIGSAAEIFGRPVFAVIDGPFQDLVNRMGLMTVLTGWIQDQEEITHAYKALSEKALGFIDKILEQPVSAIVIADDFASGSGPLVSPADIETLFSPFYQQAVQAINKTPTAVFLHSCGKLDSLLPIFKSWRIDGFCAIQNSLNNLEHMAHLFDGRIMIMAGIEPELLETQPPPAGPLKAGASIYLMAGLFLTVLNFLYHKTKPPLKKPSWRYRIGCGSLFFLYAVTFFLALGLARDHHQVLEIGLINYLWPTLTLLFSLFLLQKKSDLFLLPGTLCALLGVFFVLTQNHLLSWNYFSGRISQSPLPYTLALMAAVVWGLYSNLARRWTANDEAGSVHGFFLVAALSYLTPFFSTLVSSLYLGVDPKNTIWIGCALIILGSFLSWKSISNR